MYLVAPGGKKTSAHRSSRVLVMRRILFGIGAVLFAINGLAVLVADDCNSVSFDGQGGRVMTAICSPDNAGALPSWIAAVGMLAIAVLFVRISIGNRRFL
jgi:hypothetical protein